MTTHKNSTAAFLIVLLCGCNKATSLDSRKPEQIQFDTANALLKKGMVNEARAALDTSLRLNNRFVPSYLLLAQIDFKSGEVPKAIERLETLHRASPNEPHVLCRLAELHGVSGRFVEGFTAAKTAKEAEPDCPRALTEYASQVASSGDQKAAILQLEQIHQKFPKEDRAALLLAQLYLRVRRVVEAKAIVDIIPPTSRFRDDADVLQADLMYFHYPNPLAGALNPARAVELLNKVLARNPNHALANLLKGRLLLVMGDANGALIALQRSLATSEPNYELLTALAEVQAKLKNPAAPKLKASAERFAQSVDKLYRARQQYIKTPDNKDAMIGLANIELLMGNEQNARDLVTSVLKIDPNDKDALRMLTPNR